MRSVAFLEPKASTVEVSLSRCPTSSEVTPHAYRRPLASPRSVARFVRPHIIALTRSLALARSSAFTRTHHRHGTSIFLCQDVSGLHDPQQARPHLPASNGTFTCRLCSRSYTSGYRLREHLRTAHNDALPSGYSPETLSRHPDRCVSSLALIQRDSRKCVATCLYNALTVATAICAVSVAAWDRRIYTKTWLASPHTSTALATLKCRCSLYLR